MHSLSTLLWPAHLTLVLYMAAALVAALHALLTKPDPRSAVSWIALCWLFPFAGPILYWLAGINRVRGHTAQARPATLLPEALHARGLPADDPLRSLQHAGAALTQLPLLAGNRVEVLHEGEVAFPRMLEAIATARRTVWLATYIFQTDDTGRRFVEALEAAVARGVDVRVLVDGIGEWYSWPHVVPQLRRARVPTARFLPPRLWPPNLSLNCRNHRKILVADGRQAFIGGMNIGGREMAGTGGRRMSDVHFELHGPVVSQVADTFADDWRFACNQVLPSPAQCAVLDSSDCRVIAGGPDRDVDKLLLALIAAASVASRRIQIMTPYFIPPPELVAALQAAALRGVDVSVVLPQRSNLRYVDWATRHWLPELISRGVRIYLQEPPFSHAKLLVIDERYAQIGSVNVDTRSLRLNFEIAVEVFDARRCGELGQFIDAARRGVSALTLEEVLRQSMLARVRNNLCWLVSPYL